MGKKISYGINIYIYMYIRIAFFIELRLRVSRSLRSLANKYSTHPRGISINIAPKVGIFPEAEAEVNIHYQGCNIIDIPQGRVEYLFYYIG